MTGSSPCKRGKYFASGEACFDLVGMGRAVAESGERRRPGMTASSTETVWRMALRKWIPEYSESVVPQPGRARPVGRVACTIIAQRVNSDVTRRYMFCAREREPDQLCTSL